MTAGKIAATALAIGLLASAGCGRAAKAPTAHAPSAGDIAWLRTYGLWTRRLRSDLRAAETLRASLLRDAGGAAGFAVAVNRLSTCGDRYRRNVGVAPSPVWRRAAELALGACRGYSRGERLLLAAVGREGGGLLLPGNNALDRAGQTMTRANVRFEHSFVWNRPLPRVGGVRATSRIEPLFSRVATPIARRPVEIRCWSRADWGKVLAEFQAWEPGGVDPAGFVGSVSFSHSANLGPWTCDRLDRIAYRGEYPRAAGDQLELASAVQILSHEIQHLVAAGTEAQTECYGLQALERVAPASARRLHTLARSRCASGATAIRPMTPCTTRSSAATAGRSTRTRSRRGGPDQPPMYDISILGRSAVFAERSSE